MKKIKTIFIVGPTASGKTDLSIYLAEKINAEIISADSMQIYKNIPIASAVPTMEEKRGIKHYLQEVLNPTEEFSVYEFCDISKKLIKEINGKNKVPMVVGGTGLYIDSLLNNIDFGPENDPNIRNELYKKAEENGILSLYEELKSIDFEFANKISCNDKKRIIRALEIYYTHNTTMSQKNENSLKNEGFLNPLIIGINYENRENLYNRINLRVDIMAKNGLLEEAEKALKENYSGAKQAIGHKELEPFIKGEISLSEALENLKMQTRRYAERQITWFKRNKDIHWVYPDINKDYKNEALKLAEDFLK